MKRDASCQSVSPDHPAVAFHREVLIVQQWTLIRQAFLDALQRRDNGVAWREPSKLWRHSQEALGKWILSQVARVRRDSTAGAEGMAGLHFFPTAEDFRRFKPHGRAYDEQLIRDLSLKSRDGDVDATVVQHIQQLVRNFDLAGRCQLAHEAVERQVAEAVGHVQQTRAEPAHCQPPSSSSPLRAPAGRAALLAQPRLRRSEEDDRTRTAAQRRVHGPLAEVTVQWPAHTPRQAARNCPAVSLPWAAFQKLMRSYEYYNTSAARAAAVQLGSDAGTDPVLSPSLHMDEDYSHDAFIALTPAQALLYRAATTVLRYEGGLATGSLQLCADTSLKQHLHARGYHVMDLCASPINAYMGVPAVGHFARSANSAEYAAALQTASISGEGPAARETQSAGKRTPSAAASAAPPRVSSLAVEQERPNFFCSAFLDTDRFFGSLGSNLCVDHCALYSSAYVNPAAKPLLLTLDVPYDEDLCELLFQKLIGDMEKVTKASSALRESAMHIDYVLVLPLWWSIPFRIEKQLFTDDTHIASATAPVGESAPGASARPSDDTRAAAVMRVVAERSAMLQHGYQVPYHWPTDLAAAAGDARSASAVSSEEAKQHSRVARTQPWVCFDSLFVGNSGYAYFSTETNRWLHGVTATEVVGLAQPQEAAAGEQSGSLRRALEEYYL